MISLILMKVLSVLYFMLPAYIANMAPVLVRRFNVFNIPIDAGRKAKDGRPVFGTNKTWRGVIAAVIFGTSIFALQQRLYVIPFWKGISIINYPIHPAMLGFALSFGAILGDLVESYFKRRINIPSGKPWIPFDQVDFVFGALVFSMLYYVAPLWVWGVAIVISPLLHIITNHIAYYLKIRKQKW